MKDFDRERAEAGNDAAEFRFGGDTFAVRDTVPMSTLRLLDRAAETVGNGDTIDVYTDLVLRCIRDDDGAHDRFRHVLERDDNPVGFRDLLSLVRWLVEEQTRLPTAAPSPSTPGRETNGSASTEGSSSPEGVVYAI